MRIAAVESTLISTGEVASLPTMTSRVDPEGARRMMEMLVNLYADRRLAVVREYISNAVDATKVVGSTEPVRVTVPTVLEPSFIVTDAGTGMSCADVEAVFLAFAASTKRDSDDLIGGLGVGAKSAWALSESFLVDTVRDGRRTVVRASRDLAHQVILADSVTDLPQGTTITVPVEIGEESAAWQSVVRQVASAHAPGAVLVDGEPVESLAEGSCWIGPIAARKVNGAVVTIRSGGTLFAATKEVAARVIAATNLTAALVELPVGSFDHTPSRESVISSARTMSAVETALDEFAAAYADIHSRISALSRTNVQAALSLRADILGSVGGRSMFPVPVTVIIPAGIGAWNHSGRWNSVRDAETEVPILGINMAEKLSRTLVVSDVPKGRKLRGFSRYLESIGMHPLTVIPVGENEHVALPIVDIDDAPIGQSWVIDADTENAAHLTFAELSAGIAAMRETRGSTPGYRCVIYSPGSTTSREDLLDAKEIVALGLPVCYIEGDLPRMAPTVDLAGHVVVGLGRRKVGPLLKAIPTATTRRVWLQQRLDHAVAGMSRLDLLAALHHSMNGVRGSGGHHANVTDLVADLPAMPDHPLAETFDQLRAISITAQSVPEAAKSVAAGWNNTDLREELNREAAALRSKVLDAYPLLKHMSVYDGENKLRAYAHYLTHTPPMAVES